jgi:hypothetical protein
MTLSSGREEWDLTWASFSHFLSRFLPSLCPTYRGLLHAICGILPMGGSIFFIETQQELRRERNGIGGQWGRTGRTENVGRG